MAQRGTKTAGKLPATSGPGRRARAGAEKPEWDVVVIGTGMGGSSAGAIAALHGLKTLISVKTLAGWIGKSSGSAITTSQTPEQVGIKRPGHKTPVRGLYIAGDCGGTARSVGTELACQSGMDCGDLVAHDIENCLLEP